MYPIRPFGLGRLPLSPDVVERALRRAKVTPELRDELAGLPVETRDALAAVGAVAVLTDLESADPDDELPESAIERFIQHMVECRPFTGTLLTPVEVAQRHDRQCIEFVRGHPHMSVDQLVRLARKGTFEFLARDEMAEVFVSANLATLCPDDVIRIAKKVTVTFGSRDNVIQSFVGAAYDRLSLVELQQLEKAAIRIPVKNHLRILIQRKALPWG